MANPPLSLPEPDAEARAVSEQLALRIRAEMAAHGGSIPFHRFMALALYTPELGYYTGRQRKFGPHGDFVTAPEISPLFARCLARQCAQVLRECTDARVLEFGAGSGILAADLLLELERLGALPEQYQILEISADLRARQIETLQQHAPHLMARINWLDTLPAKPFEGVILANEVLDAMPVHCIRVAATGAVEKYVGWDTDHFVWHEGPLSDPALASRAATLPADYETEINLAAEGWVRTIAPLLHCGTVLLIDYGFPAPEFFHPQRNTGTLACHYRHRVHHDPLIFIGLQDITAHVDFTAVAQAGFDSGLHVAGYAPQAHFLLGCGLDRLLMEMESAADAERWRIAQQVQQLTSPAEMGELFKVLALTRGIESELIGFTITDHRSRL